MSNVVNGWSIFLHLLFHGQITRQRELVEKRRQKDPAGYLNKNATKRLAAITRLAFEIIPQVGAKIIVYAWVNDDDTLRAYDSKDDAYRVFRKMLDGGNPPASWEELLEQSLP